MQIIAQHYVQYGLDEKLLYCYLFIMVHCTHEKQDCSHTQG
jgi:hypothetical protein